VAGIVVLDANTLAVEETVVERAEVSFPYIPGLFSFRELPPVIMALAQLEHSPDLLVCDGHGIAHPRRFGFVNPVYVSPGHRISIEESVEWILRLCPKYRLPETTRHADHAVNMAL